MDSLFTIPLSPALDSIRACHSLNHTSMLGLSVYTALLFAKALQGVVSYQLPLLAYLIRSSDGLDRDIVALRLIDPLITTSAILHIMSWHSKLLSFLPEAPVNIRIANSKSSTSGLGPDARPPNTLSLDPSGLTSDTSHDGIRPL